MYMSEEDVRVLHLSKDDIYDLNNGFAVLMLKDDTGLSIDIMLCVGV